MKRSTVKLMCLGKLYLFDMLWFPIKRWFPTIGIYRGETIVGQFDCHIMDLVASEQVMHPKSPLGITFAKKDVRKIRPLESTGLLFYLDMKYKTELFETVLSAGKLP